MGEGAILQLDNTRSGAYHEAGMPLTSKEVIRALERGGWVRIRQDGSHIRMRNPFKPANSVTISVHQGKELPAGTLRAILRSAGLSPAEFEEMLRQ